MDLHQDILKELNSNITLSEKLESIHRVLKERFSFIDRVAVAVYDAKTDLLKTFTHSSGGKTPLSHYESKLSESRSLTEILEKGLPRVVNDLAAFGPSRKEHTRKIAEQGYVSRQGGGVEGGGICHAEAAFGKAAGSGLRQGACQEPGKGSGDLETLPRTPPQP